MTERVSGAGECAGGKELEGASEWPEAALGCGNMPRQVEAAEAERDKGDRGSPSAGGAAVRDPQPPQAAGAISPSVQLYFPACEPWPRVMSGSCSIKNLPINLSCSKWAFALNNSSTLGKNIYVLL